MQIPSIQLLLGVLISATVALGANAQDDQAPPVDSSPVYGIGNVDSMPRFTFSALRSCTCSLAQAVSYGTLVSPLPLPSPNWANQSINPNFSPAFRVEMAYAFSDCNNVQVNWTHLQASDSSSFNAKPNQMVGPYYEIGPDSNAFKIANGTARFGYDAVNMDFGHLWRRQLSVPGATVRRPASGASPSEPVRVVPQP